MIESTWLFFNNLNVAVQAIASIVGILSFLGLASIKAFFKRDEGEDEIDTKKEKLWRSILLFIGIFCLGFTLMGICFNSIVIVPGIGDTSYETAQQLLENKGLKYQVVNKKDYGNITLDKAFVNMQNAAPGDIVKKDKEIKLEIVRIAAGDTENTEKENSFTEEESSYMEISGPYADVSLYLREAIVYKILDGGSKTPVLSRNIEITPTELELFSKDYGVE